MSNVKKILIGMSIAVVIVTTIGVTGTIQRFIRSRNIERVEAGIDSIEESRRERLIIQRGFERTIAEQQRIIAARQETIKQRERELRNRNRTIERLSNTSGTRNQSLDRIEWIHKDLERRYNKSRKEQIFLGESVNN